MKISARLDLLEKEIEKFKYRFSYSSIAIKDKEGFLWFTDNKGNKIREDKSDPDLKPETVVILPEDVGLIYDSLP